MWEHAWCYMNEQRTEVPVGRQEKDRKSVGDGTQASKTKEIRMGKCPRKIRGNVFVSVLEPPTVEDLQPPFNTPFQERLANQRIAFPCPAKGMQHSGEQGMGNRS